jgi:hypothetical protein
VHAGINVLEAQQSNAFHQEEEQPRQRQGIVKTDAQDHVTDLTDDRVRENPLEIHQPDREGRRLLKKAEKS